MAKVKHTTRHEKPTKSKGRVRATKWSPTAAAKGKFIGKNEKAGIERHRISVAVYKDKAHVSQNELQEALIMNYETHVHGRPESHMTSFEKMEATRTGISKKNLEQLKSKAELDYDQLAHLLGVARNTLISKKGEDKFPVALSEKIMSLADIYSYGYEVFGNREEFNKWVLEPLPALGGKAPYDLLDNQFGREEVRNIIGRIDYGVYS